MNWTEIVKKNDVKVVIKAPEKIIEEEVIEVFDLNIIDLDEEFEKIYMDKIIELKLEFKEYIEEESLPFLNNNKIKDYDFYDFIKNNCTNLDKLNKTITIKNNEYLRELEEEEEQQEYEYNSKFNNYD